MSEINSDISSSSPDETKQKQGLETALDADKAGEAKTVAELKSPDATPAKAVTEGRQAYGTAKTENLRTSGWWRIVLPAFVIVLCVTLFAVPLIILTPLFLGSLDPQSAANSEGIHLTWMWITLAVIAVTLGFIIARGILKVFLTQAGNYKHQ